MNARKVAGCVVVAALLAAGQATASTTSTTMPVTAVTVNACAVAASPLSFGTLNQIGGGGANDSQTTLVVTCTPGTGYSVGLDAGTHASGGTRHLQQAVGSDSIPYTLYTNATRTTAWGNTVGTDTVAGTATATPATLTVYGRIPAGTPLVSAGAYSDVVTVTVSF